MHLYLSSYRFGNAPSTLRTFVRAGSAAVVIANALDSTDDVPRKKAGTAREIEALRRLGFTAYELDLRSFFGRPHALRERLAAIGLIWVRGGNTFLLRRALKQSGLDEYLLRRKGDDSLIYGGYSAGAIVVSPTLAGIERARTVGHRNREAVHGVISALSEVLSHGVLDQNERTPQASQATVEGTLGEHRREQMSQMVAHIPHDTALAFPGYAAAPLYRQTQAEHLRVAPLCRRTTTSGHAGRDVTLVKIVHDDVQCHQEGFEIEFHSHVSFGERVDMAVDSHRNLPLLSSEQDQYASSV